MTDEQTKKGPANLDRINVQEECEVRYWSDHFGVSLERLKLSVEKVGDAVSDVQVDLNREP